MSEREWEQRLSTPILQKVDIGKFTTAFDMIFLNIIQTIGVYNLSKIATNYQSQIHVLSSVIHISVAITLSSNVCHSKQGPTQEMIKGSLNLLIVGLGLGLGLSHNGIWWNLVIFFYVQAENRLSKRRLDGSLAKSLIVRVSCLLYSYSYKICINCVFSSVLSNK